MLQRPPQNQHSQLNSQNRTVAGFADLIETEEDLVAEGRNAPNPPVWFFPSVLS
jgi:hypothetical protein